MRDNQSPDPTHPRQHRAPSRTGYHGNHAPPSGGGDGGGASLCFYICRQNDIKTKNDRIYTINKDFNVAQIRYKLCRTTCDTTANSTVSNEQQAVRGISVITPLPTGEGMGEGPACAFIFIDRMTE